MPLRFEWGGHSRTQRGAIVVTLGEHTPAPSGCQCEAYFTLTTGAIDAWNRTKTTAGRCPAVVMQTPNSLPQPYLEGGAGDSLSSPWDLGYGRSAWTPGMRFSPLELKRGSPAEAS